MNRKILFHEHGGPEVLRLTDAELPEPGRGEVRVRNHAIGVNFIDIYYRTGLYPSDLPGTLGKEGAGVVEAVGPGVNEFQEGDRVAYVDAPRGAYADTVIVADTWLIPLPAEIPFETAAGCLLKGLTAQYLLRQTHEVKADETIVFHAAAGGVGLIACQWAASLGARVIGTTSSAAKAERARANGAWQIIDYTQESVPERVMALTDNQGVPVVYDSVGRDTWQDSLQCLQKRGLMVSFGNASGPVEGVNLVELNRGGSLFVTRPSLGGYADTPQRLAMMCRDLFEVLTSGDVQIHIGQRYSLAEAGEAQQAIAERRTTGSTIVIP